MEQTVNEEALSLAEFVALPTTIDFNVINSDRFKLYAAARPYLRVGTELANGYVPVYTNQANLEAVFRDLGSDFIGFYPRILSPLDDKSNFESGITQVLSQPYLNLSGKGVVIGIVDTGIDYQSPAFRTPEGKSKILRLWDQTIEGSRPDYLYYGAAYSNEDIDRALAAPDPYAVVPSRDTDGHGTFLASVAASSEENEYIGAAPGASLMVVKLRRAHPYYIQKFLLPPENPNLYEVTDYLLGVKYILDRTEELNVPVVILIGMGTNLSGHDGTTLFEEYISFVSQRPGYVFVTAAGNESNLKHHTQGRIARTGATDTVNLRVGERDASFSVIMFANAYDKLSVSITSPTGEVVPRLPFRAGASFEEKLIFEKTLISVEYYRDVNSIIFLKFRNATRGIWEIKLFGDAIVGGDYYAWLPVAGQVSPDVEFLRPVPENTIVSPATSQRGIATGAYNGADGSLFVSSSWGPTRLPRMAPDLVAPGVNVKGIYPTGTGVMSGTSVAASIVAGACALLLEWGVVNGNEPAMDGNYVRTLLIAGCDREEGIVYPNVKWGYGKLNLFGAFTTLKESNVNYQP